MFRPTLIAILATVLMPALLSGLPAPARADDAPRVVASIAPVHSLVARVMDGIGAPVLLLPPGASPHDYALKPSDARALAEADLVVWIGPRIERWLERPLETLAGAAARLRLDSVPGLTRLALRETAGFGAEEHGQDHDHDHGETDPHLWLDPDNAALWLDAIAAALAKADPAHADAYRANAATGRVELAALTSRLEAQLAPLRGRPFVVQHDGYRYFEHRFGIEAAGAIALSDAQAPGPARIARIRAFLAGAGAACLFREAQGAGAHVDLVAEGTDARIGTLDPLGAVLAPGPGLYPVLLQGLADSLADCLRS